MITEEIGEPLTASGGLSADARSAMLDLILTAAMFDAQVTLVTSAAFGLSLDRGSILTDRMDVTSKLARLHDLAKHDGRRRLASQARRLKKDLEHPARIRGFVAHSICAGVAIEDENVVCFLVTRPSLGRADHMLAAYIPIHEFDQATSFYRRATATLGRYTAALKAFAI